MTEEEWLTTRDARAMHQHVTPFSTDDASTPRLRRLFGCACCRLVWSRFHDHEKHVIETLERVVEGHADEAELQRVVREPATTDDSVVKALIDRALSPYGGHSARVMWLSASALGDDYSQHAKLLRCVFGNPFQPLAPRRPTLRIQELAQICEAEFPAVDDTFVVLADALEELGELRAAAHCCEPHHVRGCHVIDWALGKR